MGQVEAYLAREYSGIHEVLEGLIDLYRRYKEWGLADPHFDDDFTSGRDEHFYGRVWEMVLASHLKCLGLELFSSDAGPDFGFTYHSQRIWIEAICPAPEGIPDGWLTIQDISEPPRVRDVPHKEMLLRWTDALKEKKEKLTGRTLASGERKLGYLENAVVRGDEPYVIAISACRLGNPSFMLHEGISGLPYAVEAVFPVGPIEMVINKETMQLVDQRYSYRRTI